MHSAPQAEHLQANKRHGVRLLFGWTTGGPRPVKIARFLQEGTRFSSFPGRLSAYVRIFFDAMTQLAHLV
jgi:hypothetical protein